MNRAPLVFHFDQVTLTTYLIALAGACSLGLSKAGFPGLSIINVFIIAELFGAKNSVGIILPLLIVCDFIVYPLFRKYATWKQALHLAPPIIIGVLALILTPVIGGLVWFDRQFEEPGAKHVKSLAAEFDAVSDGQVDFYPAGSGLSAAVEADIGVVVDIFSDTDFCFPRCLISFHVKIIGSNQGTDFVEG